MFIALLISLYANAAAPTQAPGQSPTEILKNEIHAQIPRGDLVNFEILRVTRGKKGAELVYTLSYVKDRSIIRQLTKARYEMQNGAWVLTQVAPLDRQIEFLAQ